MIDCAYDECYNKAVEECKICKSHFCKGHKDEKNHICKEGT